MVGANTLWFNLNKFILNISVNNTMYLFITHVQAKLIMMFDFFFQTINPIWIPFEKMNLQNHGDSNFQPRGSLCPKGFTMGKMWQMTNLQVESLFQVIHVVLIQKNANVKQYLHIINLPLNQESCLDGLLCMPWTSICLWQFLLTIFRRRGRVKCPLKKLTRFLRKLSFRNVLYMYF